ncbi:MAG: hypothetical protein ACRBN8_39725 [Nannocystales bacterium]
MADGDRERGESVSVSGEQVVWVATGFGGSTQIRAHDLEGVELWSAETSTDLGEGGLRLHSVAAGPLTVFAGTEDYSTARMMGLDGKGEVVFEHVFKEIEHAGGVAIGSDGSLLFAGSDQDLRFRTFDEQGLQLFSDSYDHGGDEFVADATPDPDGGYFLAAHSNNNGTPLLVRLSSDGAVEWVAPVAGREGAQGVAADGAGGAWLALDTELGNGGALDHYDADGNVIDTIELGFFAQQVAIGPSGDLAVLGRDRVQRRSLDGDVIASAVIEGYWGLDMEIDAACDVYVSGSDETGAFLVKLD